MRKFLLSTIAAVCAFAMTANAQLFLAGSAGFNTNSKGAMPNSKAFNFSFSPAIGYFITDDISVGISLNYNRTKTTDKDNNDEWAKSSVWTVNPFARYKFAELGDFSILVEGDFAFGKNKSASKIAGVEATTEDELRYSFEVFPVLAYSLSEHFIMELNVDFLNLGFYHYGKKDNQFSFGVDTYGCEVTFLYKL